MHTANAVGRAAADMRSGCHSQRIGGKDQLHVRGGLSGNPVQREMAERGWTPRVTARRAIEAYGGASGLLHPQDPSLESGDQGVRSEPS